MAMRRSPQTTLVLAELLREPREWSYGYDLSKSTGLKSGTLYPILMRLAENQMLETSWETTVEGRPPRHLYRLTEQGVRYAREQVGVKAGRAQRRIPALGEAVTS